MSPLATVALPVRNAGPALADVLRAVLTQRVPGEVELLVCDSGSTDGSPELAARLGATVIRIAPEAFSHGGTRNLLMERSGGSYVAFLTQDALPVDNLWLSRLLSGFALAGDVGLVFGPYAARADASPMVARELGDWFAGFAPDGRPRVDRLTDAERAAPATALLGPRGFFTDANGCVARRAWERVRFREIDYAEDRALALDMLRAGFSKVFEPAAAVVHSHEYSTWGWLQRAFDEARALRAVYGWQPPADPRTLALNVWGSVGADRRFAIAAGATSSPAALARSAAHHLARTTGAALGGRADRLPAAVAQRLSAEGRAR
jgi:glycosyltransferase involved in cell wall biosynthesis